MESRETIFDSQVVLADILNGDGTTEQRIHEKGHILETLDPMVISVSFTLLHNAN